MTRAITTMIVLLLLASPALAAEPAMPQIPDKQFNIADFGAKADGTTNDSKAIDAALDAAEKAGGGVIHFGAGKYLTGPVRLRSKVGLNLGKDATLRFSTNPADYPPAMTRWEGTECINFSALIVGRDLHDIAITGQGAIDGQGANWWPWSKKAGPSAKKLREMGESNSDPNSRIFGTVEAALRPCLFEPTHCQRILLDGVTFTNSPFWTLHPLYCNDITVKNLTVHGDGPNTDGFDPDSCANILVENCTFDTGDDCITLKSGRDKDGRRVGKSTENVVVKHCTFQRGHGTVVIGSEESGGVKNVVAEDLTADGTDAGVRIKARRGRGGVVENITYRNLKLKNIAKQAITIDMFYDVGNNPDSDPSGQEGLPVFRNITIENLTCDGANQAILIHGLPDAPIDGVTLKDIQITNAKQGVMIGGCENLKTGNVEVKVK